MLVLAALAIVILAGGAVFRPKKAEPEPPAPSETAYLQTRVRREELGQTASYFAQRAEMLAQYVFYDAPHRASSVVWARAGQALTISGGDAEGPEPPMLLTVRQTGSPPATRPIEQNAGHWLIVVGRTPTGQLLWTPAIFGGVEQGACDGEPYTELVTNTRLEANFLGAGVFDLDEILVGVVGRCQGSYHLISVASVPALLDAFERPERQLRRVFGLTVVEAGDEIRQYFKTDSGLLISGVVHGGPAEKAGLRAGDVITAINGNPVTTPGEVADAVLSEGVDEKSIQLLRSHRKLILRMPTASDIKAVDAAEKTRGIQMISPEPAGELISVAAGDPRLPGRSPDRRPPGASGRQAPAIRRRVDSSAVCK